MTSNAMNLRCSVVMYMKNKLGLRPRVKLKFAFCFTGKQCLCDFDLLVFVIKVCFFIDH